VGHIRLGQSIVAVLDRQGMLAVARPERFVGRVAIAALVVGSLLVLQQLLLPGAHIDALWIAMIAAILVTAVLAGFLASLITTFVAAVAIDVWFLEPRGTLLVSSRQDLVALALFVFVSILGAAATSRPRGPAADVRPAEAPVAGQTDRLIEPLTDRELEVLGLLSRGLSNAEIAGELVVSENTVKSHLEHLYGKLEVTSRGRAVAEGRRRGLFVALDDRITRSSDRIHPSG
jgi:DNA-binding CsgD family transcriptional regulator